MSRRRLRIILIVAGVLAGAYIAASWAVGHVAAEKAAARLHERFGIDVRWRWAWYRPPMGLALRGATISLPGADGREVQLLAADYFRVDLQSFPRAGQPVRIADMVLAQPVLHIERQANGVVLRPHPATRPVTAPPAPGFTIHRADIRGGRIEYRNDLSGQSAFVIALPDLTLDCTQPPGQPISFTIRTPPGPSPSLDAAGTIDAAQRQLNLDHLTLAGDLSDATVLLPTQAVERLRLAGASGAVRLAIHGTVGLNGPPGNNWSGSLGIRDASVEFSPKLPARHINADVSLASSTTPGILIAAVLQHADADTGGASLRIDSAKFQADTDGWKIADALGHLDMHGSPMSPTFFDQWEFRGRLEFTAAASGPYRLAGDQGPFEAIAHEVLAYPRGVAFRPPKFPRSFEQIVGGSVAFRAGIVSFDHLRGKYGDDIVVFNSGRLILEDSRRQIPLSDLARRIELTDITSTILFAAAPPKYPPYLQKIMTDLCPTGGFGISGTLIFPRRAPGQSGLLPLHADYNLTVASTGDGQLTLFGKAKLQSVEGSADLTPSRITIPRIQGVLFGGTTWAHGTITPDRPARSTLFAGQIIASDLQLAQVAAAAGMKPATVARLAGLAGIRADVADTVVSGTPWFENLQGSGEFEAYNGAFASLPVISDVIEHKHPAPPPPTSQGSNTSAPAPMTVDEAAGMFTIADHRITFSHLAISSPIIGLVGAGTVGFDRSLDLNLVIAPLGDWRGRAKQANIPIVSDVAGDVLGAVQKVLSAAQGSLINAVHVGGTASSPTIQDTPAPAITNGLVSLFGQMLQPPQPHRLLNAVRGEQPPTTKPK